jgi:hypothetical protein
MEAICREYTRDFLQNVEQQFSGQPASSISTANTVAEMLNPRHS